MRVLLQIAVFLLAWLTGEAVVRFLHLPLPGGIVALAVLLVLLGTGLLRVESVKQGADWLLGRMLLFFVPALLAVIDHPEFLGATGLKLLFVIVAGTLAVMAVTGLVVEFALRRKAGVGSAKP